MALLDRLDSEAPKRILSLDGGGIRGILTLGFLERVEQILKERADRNDFVLADYFDLIGGTSTGSILAAGLSTGMHVKDLIALYEDLGSKVFRGSALRGGLLFEKFPSGPLRRELTRQFGTMQLSDPEIRTGLLVMTKRLDSGSAWPIHNHPRGRFYSGAPVAGTVPFPNKDFSLAQVVRASTAAPSFFEPEDIIVGDHQGRAFSGSFVDGGVSPHNNPALQLLMLATMSGHGFGWTMGPEDLFMLSLGTGSKVPGASAKGVSASVAIKALKSLMDDCAELVETIMQWVSESPTARPIDLAVGDLAGELLGGRELLTYVRYNVFFDVEWMQTQLGVMNVTATQLSELSKMDEPDHVHQLLHLGRIAAHKLVDPAHLP
ncbi:MAG: patatin-like phospholipase family protein [Rhodothermales bacterium]|nr:patatin-like phospholipase family protein [Rhodothermales bacterium]MBO6781052.1 patatin-like phospholipase family protein [Rhodothermales bacterium]